MTTIEPAVFREALALHAIFHTAAGIPYDDIYVAADGYIDPETEEPGLAVQAQQGKLTFTVVLGSLGMSKDEFAKKWPEAVRQFKAMNDADAKALVEATAVRDRAMDILLIMTAKGFKRPERPAGATVH